MSCIVLLLVVTMCALTIYETGFLCVSTAVLAVLVAINIICSILSWKEYKEQ